MVVAWGPAVASTGVVAAACASPPTALSSAMRTFQHHDETQPIAFGIQLPEGRSPLAFVEATALEVMDYLRDDPRAPFTCIDEKLGESGFRKWGFASDSGEPILKTDWHGQSSCGDGAKFFVPRLNALSPMRRAPPRIVAFIEAFRAVNIPCWKRVSEAMEHVKKRALIEDNQELCNYADIFSRAITERTHFGGVEAQVWRGGELVMKSHTDGAMGLLHLGLTLGGRRTLRVGKFSEQHSPYRSQESRRRGKRPGDEVSVWNPAAYHKDELWDVEQVGGSAYLSLPFSFEHGVQYNKGNVADPVIALQCRFAFISEAEALEVNGQRTGNMRVIAEAMAEALSAAVDRSELRMPSLHEISALEAQLLVGDELCPPLPGDRGHLAREARPSTRSARIGSALFSPTSGRFTGMTLLGAIAFRGVRLAVR